MSKGILIDYEWCSGCYTCVVACQKEHGLAPDRYGIKIETIGPWEISEDVWQYDHLPVLTDQCDLCEERVSKGKVPTCAKHCQAAVIKYGDIEDLAKDLAAKKKQVLYSK